MMKEPVVGTKSGILAIGLCAVTVLICGAMSISYKSECARDDTGKRTCTDNIEFLGWAGVPLQPIASAIGIGAGAFIAIARCKNPGEVIEYIARSKNDDDISSQD